MRATQTRTFVIGTKNIAVFTDSDAHGYPGLKQRASWAIRRQIFSNSIAIRGKRNYNLRSNIKLLLQAPIPKTLPTLGDRAVQAAAPKLWNDFPSGIRQIDKIDIFKRCLKTYFF